jgi:hypothetical protein
MDIQAIDLPTHELASQERARQLMAKLDELKGNTMDTITSTGAPPVNVFASNPNNGMNGMWPMLMGSGWGGGAGAGAGAGLGAGLVGGLLGGALFGGNGFGNNHINNGNFITQSDLQSALNGQTMGQNTNMILQNLASISAAIPENEGKVQLAIAGATSDINGNISMSLQTAINGQAGINKNISEAIAQSLASQGHIQETVLTSASAINLGIANLGATVQQGVFATTSAARDQGDRIIAALNAQNEANLQRQLTVSELSGLENRLTSRNRDVEVTVSQAVTQNQNQLQAQQQQQQQQQQILFTLAQILPVLGNLQNAVATNSNLIVGNTGATTTGAQTANPVNVKG